MTREDMTALVDNAFEAVDKSKFGPMVITVDTNGVKICSSTAYGIAQTIIASLLPKGSQHVTHHTERSKESWEE